MALPSYNDYSPAQLRNALKILNGKRIELERQAIKIGVQKKTVDDLLSLGKKIGHAECALSKRR